MSSAHPSHAAPPELVIRPESSRTLGFVGDLWAFRDLLWSLADRDLRLRYRQTVLGVAWVVLQPLLGALIFTFVFGVVAGLSGDGVPYFILTFASLAGWALFAGIFTRASGSLVQNSGLIAKVWFPRVVLPCSTVPAALIDFAIASVVLAGLMLATGTPIPATVWLVPLWILGLVVLAVGLGLVGAALMVSYRDVQHILPVGIQLLLYASPVAYAATHVPERYLALYYLNPLAPLLEGLRASLLGTPMPPMHTVAWAAGVAAAALLVGVLVFRRLERKFADVI